MLLEQNIKGLCSKFGIDYIEFLGDMDVDHPNELSVYDLEAICEEYNLDLQSLLFKPVFRPEMWNKKLDKIKLLVLDVDGVMTDGGMYYTESGDQIKKYNTKDGMAIQHLVKSNFQVGVISHSLVSEMVKKRCDVLGIQNCYVGKELKIKILNEFCTNLGLTLENVALIGDDVNDLEMIRKIGFSACPADAVNTVKSQVNIVLSKKGGEGCVREFVDTYLLKQPLD